MREKITNLLQKFYKVKGYEILLSGLFLKMYSPILANFYEELQNVSRYNQVPIVTTLLPILISKIGMLLLTLGIIKTTADIIIGIEKKYKKTKKEDQNVR